MAKITRRYYQEEAIASVKKYAKKGVKRQLIALPTASGKCVTPDTLVWNKGLTTFGELWGSESILAPQGKEKINGWYDDGLREGRLIQTVAGWTINGTLQHRLWVRNPDGYEGWRLIKDLRQDDYIALARGRADFGDEFIPLEEAYVLGLILADGCLVATNEGTSWHLQLDGCISTFPEVWPVFSRWRQYSGGRSDGRVQIKEISSQHHVLSINAPRIRQFLEKAYGMVWGYSSQRTVPKVILQGAREVVCAFLRGYFDGDGGCSGGDVEYSTCNPILAKQVAALLLGLGIACGIKIKRTSHLPAYRVVVYDIPRFWQVLGFKSDNMRLTKHRRLFKLSQNQGNRNLDVVPGVGALLRRAGNRLSAKYKRKDAWRHADAYYSGIKKPSYKTLREFEQGLPNCPEKEMLQKIIADNYFWCPIKSITSSIEHRIDCEVNNQHAFIGNGMVNHNTIIFAGIIQECNLNKRRELNKPWRVLVIAHRKELLEQAEEKISWLCPELILSTERAEFKAFDESHVVLASVATLGRAKSKRLERFNPEDFCMIITDEGHHSVAEGYERIYDYFGVSNRARDAGRLHIAVTATPIRGDGVDLSKIYDRVVYQKTILDLTPEFLVPCRHRTILTEIGLDEVGTYSGKEGSDFKKKELAQALNKTSLNSLAVDSWLKYAKGQKTVVFCVDVAHVQEVTEAFNNKNIPAKFVTGETPPEEREAILKMHREGKFKVLVNCEVLCLDEETEILTSKGWVGIDAMTYEHQIANWNQGTVTFSSPKNIIRREREEGERMVTLESRGRSVRVTEGHRMLYRDRSSDQDFKKAAARDLVGQNIFLPVSGQAEALEPQFCQAPDRLVTPRKISYNAHMLRKREKYEWEASFQEAERRLRRIAALRYKSPSELSPDECRLIGFWLGDGCLTSCRYSGGTNCVISQSETYPRIIEWVDTLLARLQLSNSRVVSRARPDKKAPQASVRWYLNRGTGSGSQECEGYFPIEPYLNKESVEYLWNFSEEQFDAFLDGYWFADGLHGAGEKTPTIYRLFSTNKNRLDTLQAVAACRGYWSSLRAARVPQESHHQQGWILTLRKTPETQTVRNTFEIEEGWKSERVWCVTSETGNIITRRHGTVTVMGNCEGYDDPSLECLLILRPTKSRLLLTQMVGRGSRRLLKPGTDEVLLNNKGEPVKSYFNVIELADSHTRHQVASTPEIYSLPQIFDGEGEDLYELSGLYDELVEQVGLNLAERVKGARELRKALENVEKIKAQLQSGQAYKQATDLDFAEFAWFPLMDSSFRVSYDKSKYIVVRPDLLGNYSVGVREGRVTKILGQRGNLEEAIRAAEAFTKKTFPKCLPLVLKDIPWRGDPPSPKQLKYAKQLKLRFDPKKITKGELANLISQRVAD
jgi:superfamily II DNA or RNA helicase/intein/homing endonuclease